MADRARPARRLAAAAMAGTLAASACSPGSAPTAAGGELNGVELMVTSVWTGPEQENFEEVLKEFEQETGATVEYQSTGEDVGAYLGPKIEAGEPPDVAILQQRGLLEEYAAQDALVPLKGDAAREVEENYGDNWRKLGTVGDETYGILVKAAHKSIVWYRPDSFEEAGVKPPRTWGELTGKTSSVLSEAGITPFAMCGATGWTLTDWFENVYLSRAGPQKYDQLVSGDIEWSDESVVDTLRTLADIWGAERMMDGGSKGAVQTDFPTCVNRVYGQDKAAMVYEADFAAAPVQESGATVGEDARAFPFPAVGKEPPVVLGGDMAVGMTERKGVQELLAFLASAEAQSAWAGMGGYLSANSKVGTDAYADEFTRELAGTIRDAGEDARFDISDQAPSEFGATEGKGMWAILQDFLRDPSDPEGTAEELQKAASAAES